MITGATGFLGSYVTAELLRRGHSIVALSRRKGAEGKDERVFKALRFWGIDNPASLPDLKTVEGDVEREGLGVRGAELACLDKGRFEVLHCAACTSFTASPGDFNAKTNVEGTRNTLDLAKKIGAAAVHIVSTAYVAGEFPGSFGESDLSVGQGFNNIYEETKYRAEVMARDFLDRNGIPGNIFRPSIIMGECTTGRTTNFKTFYPYFKALCSIRNRLSQRLDRKDKELAAMGIGREQGFLVLPVRLSARPQALKNVVPVDFVGSAMTAIMEGKAEGIRTFHLTNPDPPTVSWLNGTISEALGIRGITFAAEDTFPPGNAGFFERLLNNSVKAYRPYLAGEPRFRCEATHGLLRHLGISFPGLDETYYRRLIEFAERANFGAEKERPLERPEGLEFLETMKEKVGRPFVPNLKGLDASFSLRFPDVGKEFSLLIEKGVLARISAENGMERHFTFVLSSAVMGRLMKKELRPQDAFFERKVEIEGDVEKALALAPIFDEFFRGLGSR